MPPILRSSAPNSPVSAKTSSTASAASSVSMSARKVHHCTKCGRPRAGHPRRGCPYVDGPEDDRGSQEPELGESLGSFNFMSRQVDDKASLRAKRRVTSARFGTEEMHYLQQQYPAMMYDNYSPPEHGVHWQERLDDTGVNFGQYSRLERRPTQTIIPGSSSWSEARVQPRPRSVMPGTLHTPTSSFFGSPGGSPPPETYRQPRSGFTTHVVPQTSPLGRSLSFEEREAFLKELLDSAHAPPASMFAIPVAEIYQIQHSAARVGFYSRVIEDGMDGWLILGPDHQAVHEMFEGVSTVRKERREPPKEVKNGGKLSAVAGGAVLGAVAAFAGLALS